MLKPSRLAAAYANACELIHNILSFLLPPLCLACDEQTTRDHTLCAACWKNIRFIAPPYCARCGAPFDLPVEGDTLCGACLEKEPPFATARSAVLYDDASKNIIIRLKHSDRLHPVPALAQWMVRAGGEVWNGADLIVPVPLHRWRLLKRKYNQSALLAQAIARQTARPALVDALERTRATDSQGHMNKQERAANVAKAFALRKGVTIEGKKIVLIDDVLTSGATISECAATLLKAGAARVDVVTLARTKIAS